MSKNTSFSLGDHFIDFVDTQVEQGRYSNASDVLCAELRLLEERETTLATLRAALIDGENSGPSAAFDLDEFIARKRQVPPRSHEWPLHPFAARSSRYPEDLKTWAIEQAETYIRQIGHHIRSLRIVVRLAEHVRKYGPAIIDARRDLMSFSTGASKTASTSSVSSSRGWTSNSTFSECKTRAADCDADYHALFTTWRK